MNQSVTVTNQILETTRLLEAAAISSARLEAEILLAHCLGIERLDLYKFPDRHLAENEIKRYADLAAQRRDGVPTAYLRGKKEFFSMNFQVGPGVLIPRAETELGVEETLRLVGHLPSPKILELGTGSGAIVISLLKHLPQARAVATDFSSKALEYAGENARRHAVSDRVEFRQGDLFEPIAPNQETFEAIVSNPPYVPTAEISPLLRFEPHEALDGGPDGLLFHRKILSEAWKFLNPEGHLILEIGSTNRQLLDEELQQHRDQYTPPRFKKDLAGLFRVLILKKIG